MTFATTFFDVPLSHMHAVRLKGRVTGSRSNSNEAVLIFKKRARKVMRNLKEQVRVVGERLLLNPTIIT